MVMVTVVLVVVVRDDGSKMGEMLKETTVDG